jgi:hypothetical protein
MPPVDAELLEAALPTRAEAVRSLVQPSKPATLKIAEHNNAAGSFILDMVSPIGSTPSQGRLTKTGVLYKHVSPNNPRTWPSGAIERRRPSCP